MNLAKILIIEEDQARRSHFQELFNKLECDAKSAATAEIGLNQLEAGELFDVIILNLHFKISVLNSNQFIRKLEQKPEWKKISIVPFTTYLEYRYTNPEKILDYLSADQSNAAPNNKTTQKTIQILAQHSSFVPDEIVLWTYVQLEQHQKTTPPLLKRAVEILDSTYIYHAPPSR